MALPDAFRIWLCIKFGQEISWSVVGSLVWHPRVGGRPRVMFCYFPQGIHVCARLTSRPATILLRCPFLRASWRWFFPNSVSLGSSAIVKVPEQVGAAKSAGNRVPRKVPRKSFLLQADPSEQPNRHGARLGTGFPGRGSQARFLSKVPSKRFPSKVPRNRFPSKVPNNRFPSKVPNNRFPSKVPRKRLLARGSQARFPGRGSKQGSQARLLGKVTRNRFPSKGSQEQVPKQGSQEQVARNRFPSKGS